MVRFEPSASRGQLVGQFLWFVGWLAVTLIAAVLHPNPHMHGTHTQLGLPPCASVVLFGRPCPGCGLTTSFTCFVHGGFAGSFRAHPLGPLMYLAYTATAWAALWGCWKRRHMNTDTKAMSTSLVAFVIVFVVFGIYRFATTSGLGWTYGPISYPGSAKR